MKKNKGGIDPIHNEKKRWSHLDKVLTINPREIADTKEKKIHSHVFFNELGQEGKQLGFDLAFDT